MWFGKNELRLYLNEAKKFSIGGAASAAPPLNTPMSTLRCFRISLLPFQILHTFPDSVAYMYIVSHHRP